MDELKQHWNRIKPELEAANRSFDHQNAHESTSLLAKLQHNVKIKLLFSISFTVIFAAVLPFVYPLTSQILLGIMILAYAAGSWLLWKEYQTLKHSMDMSQDLLNVLTTYSHRVKRVIRYEELVALCLYPISAAAGFLFGFQMAAGSDQIISTQTQWSLFGLSILIITIASYFTTQWLNRKAFGGYLKTLDDNIQALKREE